MDPVQPRVTSPKRERGSSNSSRININANSERTYEYHHYNPHSSITPVSHVAGFEQFTHAANGFDTTTRSGVGEGFGSVNGIPGTGEREHPYDQPPVSYFGHFPTSPGFQAGPSSFWIPPSGYTPFPQNDNRGTNIAPSPQRPSQSNSSIEHPYTPRGPSIDFGSQADFPNLRPKTPRPQIDPSVESRMVGKKSGKALLREEGLERTDNNMKQSSWPEVPMINQKNYYTEYMKRDDQILPFRLQSEANRDKMIRNAKDKDRELARTGNTDVPIPTHTNGDLGDGEDGGEDSDGMDWTKIIVIHPGSQNLRIGLASDALPKSIPMNIACKWKQSESQEYEERPKRQKLDGTPEQLFGEEFSKRFGKMAATLKVDMRANKFKVLPNSKELVVNFNRRAVPEKIPEHNDPIRIEWTDVTKDDKSTASYFTGSEALRIPDDSEPPFKMFWPIQQGWFHENDYITKEHLFDDFEAVLESAIRKELGLIHSLEWEQMSCVVVIPDLYDKRYVEQLLDMCLKGFEFKQVAFVQESLAGTYGAGYTSACIVDIGAQKTSICCVEDGMCIEDSRVNLKQGGADVTETFIKMMLHDHFPYADINLKRRYDFLLAEELKINHCTLNYAEVASRTHDFHLRAPNQPTHKYQFKTYDEVILAPMGFWDPSLFENSHKLVGRRKFIDRSYNAYEVNMPDDPTSSAQQEILTSIKPSLASTTTTNGFSMNGNGNGNPDFATPSKEKQNPFLNRMESETNGNSRVTSAAGSPAPEGSNTPNPSAPFIFGANGTNGGSPGPNGSSSLTLAGMPPAGMFIDQNARTQKNLAIERDSILPIAPLDQAIITSIMHASHGDDKKLRDFAGGIMVIGGGSKTPGFGPFLEERLKARRPDLADKLLVGSAPRDMDGMVVVWKGASVYARMTTHESWMGQVEYERLGSRALHHKVLWNY